MVILLLIVEGLIPWPDIFSISRVFMVCYRFLTLIYALHAHRNLIHRLCGIHNRVNKRLKKPQFDCAHLDETYDCGCGGDDESGEKGSEKKDDLTGADMIRGGR